MSGCSLKKCAEGVDLSIDAHRWMRSLRFEYYRVAQLRRLRVGEQLWVGRFDGPGISEEVRGICEAYFERQRGAWSFHATWTICWRGVWRRPHVLTFGRFHLKPGNRIAFASVDDVRAERGFRRVCRYCAFFHRNSERLGVRRRYVTECGHHHLWRGEVVGRNGYNRYGCEGPMTQGLATVVETAIALGIVPGEEREPGEGCNHE